VVIILFQSNLGEHVATRIDYTQPALVLELSNLNILVDVAIVLTQKLVYASNAIVVLFLGGKVPGNEWVKFPVKVILNSGAAYDSHGLVWFV
jgi:hypothetical protein